MRDWYSIRDVSWRLLRISVKMIQVIMGISGPVYVIRLGKIKGNS